MRWNSLSTRLLVTFAAMILAVLVVVTAFSYVRTKVALEQMLGNHGKMLLDAMETTAADRLVLYDYVYLRNYVAVSAAKETVLSFAAVVNAEGERDRPLRPREGGEEGFRGGPRRRRPRRGERIVPLGAGGLLQGEPGPRALPPRLHRGEAVGGRCNSA